MSRSIISIEKECYICHTTLNLHKHHIMPGGKRKTSEKWGVWLYLCGRHHNLSNEGVHFNRQLDKEIRMIGQLEFERIYGHEKWMELFGINYL